MAAEAPARAEREKHSPKHLPAKKKGFFRRYWWVFVATPLAFMLAAFAALYVSYRQIELPDTLPPIKTSYLYDRHGNELTPLHGAVDRTIVPLGQISENLQHAVIATEDAGFYSHPGVDVKGILTAAWTDLVKRDTVVGASTITQQLVKNVYAGQYIENADGSSEYVVPPRSIKEKIREALLSIKLETELGKDQILAKYLNTVYFGHGAYGAEAAAQTYFGKAASELDVSESAVLAAVLHAPSLYDPIKSAYDNKFRRDYTLDQMAKYGYITAGRGRVPEGARNAAASRRLRRRNRPGSTAPPARSTSSTTRDRPVRQVRERQGLRRWPADHDHPRLAPAASRGGGRQRPPSRHTGEPRRLGRDDRQRHRRGPGDGRWTRLGQVQAEPGDDAVRGVRAPGGFCLQAVHLGRRAGTGLLV